MTLSSLSSLGGILKAGFRKQRMMHDLPWEIWVSSSPLHFQRFSLVTPPLDKECSFLHTRCPIYIRSILLVGNILMFISLLRHYFHLKPACFMPSIFKHINSTIFHPSLYKDVNTEQAHVHSGKVPNPATTYQSLEPECITVTLRMLIFSVTQSLCPSNP